MFPGATARLGWCWVFLAVMAAQASGPVLPPHYFTRTWQVEQGLPQNKVTAVVQTRDGYLWVGTYNGLARFDGVRFTVFDENDAPELHSSRITSLYEAADGTLWIGTESGAVSTYRDGQFVSVPVRAHWRGGKIYAITADHRGDVWLCNEAGELDRVRDDKVLSPVSGTVTNVIALARGRDDAVMIEREGIVSGLEGESLASNKLAASGYVQGLCAARDGGFWVALNSTIRKWRNGVWVGDYGAAPWGGNIVPSFLETASGALACSTPGDGLWLVFPGQTNLPAQHFTHTNGLPSDWVIAQWEDREHNLWCGTGAGLVLIRQNNVETVSPPDNWKGRPVLSVLPAPDGALWVGTEGAGLYRLQNGDWTNFDNAQGLRNGYVWSLAAGPDGRIWAGTWGGGLFVQQQDAFDFAPGLEHYLQPMPALLFEDRVLWIGTTTDAARYQTGTVKRFADIGGTTVGDVRALARESSGTWWYGTAGSGLVRWQQGSFRRFTRADGLSSDSIECLKVGDDGALWVGTFGGGLNRFKDGKFSVIQQQQGLPNDVIGHIEADGRGYFWLSSYGGILRAKESDLNRCADGKVPTVTFFSYGINDGLPTLECSEGLQAAGAKTADGRLWFPTAKGLVVVDPAAAVVNPLPPPVLIEEVRLDDGKFADGRRTGPLIIPPGQHRLEFEYTGLSFVSPEKVRFRFRLQGLDKDWTEAGTKRVAVYNYIPPGKYSFEVLACNNDGVWNEQGSVLPFTVQPYFWQTWWFRTLAGCALMLAAGGLVWLDARRRMRRKLERVERQRDIERERTRIARDIHDDLGSQLTRITMLSESAVEPEAEPHRTAENISRIYDTARELTRSMDEIVWAVNPRHDTLESLATYLEKFAQDLLAAAGVRCRLDLPLHYPEWHLTSELRHNVFLAFKEALHNAVKHANASEVLIRMTVAEKGFELVVADNGRGILAGETASPAAAASGRVASGNGLENMSRRLAAVGGSCRIQSPSGVGTEVCFAVRLNTLTLD